MHCRKLSVRFKERDNEFAQSKKRAVRVVPKRTFLTEIPGVFKFVPLNRNLTAVTSVLHATELELIKNILRMT